MRRRRLGALSVLALAQELRSGVGDTRPLAVTGSPEFAPQLASKLRAGGNASAVVEGTVEGAAAVVWVAERGTRPPRVDVPLVRVPSPAPGGRVALDEVARALAKRLGDDATSLSARLPALRPAVCAELIRTSSRHNGVLAAAIFVPGVDLPVLTLNQIRLVLRLALVHGQHIDGSRALELLGLVGAGVGLRAVAREAIGVVPLAGWAIKGAIAYAGTKALGEAAVRYFAARTRAPTG